MKKEEVLKALQEGKVLKQYTNQDFGTKSFTRPIKRTGKVIISYKIDNQKVHHKIGKTLIDSGALTQTGSERTFGGGVKEFILKKV